VLLNGLNLLEQFNCVELLLLDQLGRLFHQSGQLFLRVFHVHTKQHVVLSFILPGLVVALAILVRAAVVVLQLLSLRLKCFTLRGVMGIVVAMQQTVV